MPSESTSQDDRSSHVDATVSPPPPSPPSGGGNPRDWGQHEQRQHCYASCAGGPPKWHDGINDSCHNRRRPPNPRVAGRRPRERIGGTPTARWPARPPRFPHELDDSLAKKVDKERAASTAFNNRLQHEVIGPRERAAQETRGSTNVGDSTAAPMVQEEVTQGGTTASTIRAINDDDPPISLLQVADHENETEGPELHDGPPGLQYSLSEFDDSEKEFEQHSSDRPRGNASTVHSTTEAPAANAAADGPPMAGGVVEGSTPPGSVPPTSPHIGAAAAAAAVGLNLASAGEDIAVAYTVDEYPEEMPGRGIVYEAEPIEPQEPFFLPFYQRKSFVYVMVGMTLLIIGITMAVQLPNNSNRSAGGVETKSNLALPPQPTVSTYQGKLLAPDRRSNDEFGHGVAIYGDTIVVGAYRDGDNGSESGSAHVFVRSGGVWTHQAKLLAPDGAVDDWFGYSTAIYGDAIVVGVRGDDDNGIQSGSVSVFVRGGEEWTHQAKLLAPDGAAGDRFGMSVAIYGDALVVGAHEKFSGERSDNATSIQKRKKDKYIEACRERRRDFIPMAYSVDGLAEKEARAAEKRLASLLASKWDHPYSKTACFVKTRMSLHIHRVSFCVAVSPQHGSAGPPTTASRPVPLSPL
ncbi:hypothetical protein THAOC_30662 [Thalassiosira oceanica]|uniref:Uncharacterized protein n=1 Tax=Thalassiosira oceanica TaxID=159749 RepID=K0RDM8_THAOC|nr:hypothetical protein THAOC_30662 [Thalassiosira oceanica]|eukprot:EJK50379.1 hypothetical protein THAOC_30662 [Thalassiosira oceanica]